MNKFCLPKSVAVVSHIYTYGPPHKLLSYLIEKKVKSIYFIGHPFPYSNDINSFFRTYSNGRLTQERKFPFVKIHELFFYLKDFLLTMFWGIRMNKVEMMFCLDGYSCFLGYLLKLLGKVDHLVFYTIDYSPKRFRQSILNKLYFFFDNFSVKNADAVWNLSDEMRKARNLAGLNNKWDEKQIEVPIGVNKIFPPKNISSQNRYNIVFLGHLRKNQGLEKVVAALPKVVKTIPKVKLTIIGGGLLETPLKIMARKLKVEKNIFFTGYIEDIEKVTEELRRSVVGLAPYEDNSETFTRYADPTKPKDYLSCGLAVIITNVPFISKDIEKYKAGIVIKDSQTDLEKAIIDILRDEVKLETYRKNANRMANKFLIGKLFNQGFIQTFRLLDVL